jgi:membrane-bound serine protease (ClpP class)
LPTNIAYILMMIGLAGLYFELSHPGAIFPGVIGAISLILAFYSFQTLPVNYAGLLLIALAIILFIIEVKVASYGLLSIGGVISLTLGSIMLFEDLRVSLQLMAPTILLIGGFFVIVSTLPSGLTDQSQKVEWKGSWVKSALSKSVSTLKD